MILGRFRGFRLEEEPCSVMALPIGGKYRAGKNRRVIQFRSKRSLQRLGGTSGLRILPEENICAPSFRIGYRCWDFNTQASGVSD
jgi:hypothetical protein